MLDAMKQMLEPRVTRGNYHVALALASVAITAVAYIGALWLRWRGSVPEALWAHMAYVLPAGVLGTLTGGSIVDLFGPSYSWFMAFYSALVTSFISVVAAMAATFAFRVTALPRLAYVLAFVFLWVGLAVLAWVSSLAYRRGSERAADGGTASLPAVSGLDQESVLRMIERSGQVAIISPDAYDLVVACARVHEDFCGVTLHIEPRALRWPVALLKRLVDITISLIVLVVGLPIWLLIMLAIRLDSPGPALYRQTRVGQGGRLFEVIKFRTMVTDAEANSGPVLASADDPRITRVGRFLRAFRLDEVPQFINVLRGDMSVVGPRPERPEFVAEFHKKIQGYGLRHLVKPGITGLAQIRGNYDTPAEDKLRFDLAYIFLWSPWLDLKIMLQTVGTMLSPERARSSRPVAEAPPARATDLSVFHPTSQKLAASLDSPLSRGPGRLSLVRNNAAQERGD